MLEWLHQNHITIGCGTYGLFLILTLYFHRLVGKYTRALGWWLASLLFLVSGASWNGTQNFANVHGILLMLAGSSILLLAPVAVIIDRRRHGDGT